MADSKADTDTNWLTELDDIDPEWNITAYTYSRLGRLPTELLSCIIEYLLRGDLPAVARASPPLRNLVEYHLYSRLDFSVNPQHNRLWPLYRTLSRRPDLAEMIKEFSCAACDVSEYIKVDLCAAFPDDPVLCHAIKTSVNQLFIAGRLLLQLPSNVETVSMAFLSHGEPDFETDLNYAARRPLKKLLPAFHYRTGHTLNFRGLQNMTSLEYTGSEFHWALAKPPKLRKLTLTRPCYIRADEAPNEFNTSLKWLEISTRPDILRSNSEEHANIKPFLAHFPSLEHLKISIFDRELDQDLDLDLDWSLTGSKKLAYDSLLDRLSPVATHLRTLDLSIYDDPSLFDHTNHYLLLKANEYLTDALPASSFQQFTRLEKLLVPFTGLIGYTYAQTNHAPSPSRLLPSTLVNLEVDGPVVYIYDWLARLYRSKHTLPDLSSVALHCQYPYGDEYPLFAFEESDNTALWLLEKLGVTVNITYRSRDWEPEWDEYDLDVLNVIGWLNEL